ncbi:MAG: hypothetical protein HW405_773 [Candidatus Berkelbacteria bacterium]|nr:hypothetical protein [Candidatus Berkelbacteria bacterium]
MPVQLTPVVEKHARDLAHIIHVIHHRGGSQASIQERFEAYFRKVADELEVLGESPDKVMELALAVLGVLLDEMIKRTGPSTASDDSESGSRT